MRTPKQQNTEMRIYAKLAEIRDIIHGYSPECSYFSASMCGNHIMFTNAYFDENSADYTYPLNFSEPRE